MHLGSGVDDCCSIVDHPTLVVQTTTNYQLLKVVVGVGPGTVSGPEGNSKGKQKLFHLGNSNWVKEVYQPVEYHEESRVRIL